MKQTIISSALIAIATAVSLSSCVKDELFDPRQSESAKISVRADWSGRGDGVDVPAQWHVAIGEYEADESSHTHVAACSFDPGTYRLAAYSPAYGIEVDGFTARVSAATRQDQPACLEPQPGWLFSHVSDVSIEQGRDHLFEAVMCQQVRSLILILEPRGDAASKIESVNGYLSGAAGSLDLISGAHASASCVALDFRRIEEGEDAGNWMASVRLLGVAGDVQRLSAEISFTGEEPHPMTLVSDLSAPLSDFNSDKRVPLILRGIVADTPGAAGVQATIDNWQATDAGNVDAH